MAQCSIKPDMEFVRALEESGGESLKKCYQCATCSVACPLAPANAPYPRKEMVWASWGLKDKLRADVDLWLCHNCGNCSDLCPRGAKPADLMGAARNVIYRELTEPTCVGKLMSKPSGLPVLFAIPAVLWLFVWWIPPALTAASGSPALPMAALFSVRCSTATTPSTPSLWSPSSALPLSSPGVS